MIALVYRMLYITAEIPALPKMIHDASKGDYGELMRMEGRRLSRTGNFSHGMYFSVQCSEEIAFATPESVATTAAAFPRLKRYFSGIVENTQKVFELCNAWGVRQPDPRENEAVQSTVPTLVLAGAYDPVTPPAWGELAASTISPSYVYTFANSGHAAISSSGCPARLVRAFLIDPSVAPDGSCVAGVAGPQFR
jgi:pimeloyl-ACP methyl ester carboxylesterase